jgi:CheY-like chemotaxis protein
MLTVLVAEDEFAVLEVLSLALEAEGHRLLKAGDGADALRLLASQPVDVVVSDDIMPLLTGRQLVEAMRVEPRLSAIPVVLLIDPWAAAPAGQDGLVVLRKPSQLSEVIEAVERLGKAARSRRTT